MNASLFEIAHLIQGTIIGDKTIQIQSFSPIDQITPGSLVFADGEDNLKKAEASDAAAILVSQHVTQSNKPLIQVSHPFKSFIHLLNHFYPPKKPALGVHPTAFIADDVQLGANVAIGPFVSIDSGCTIGDNVILKDHVSIGAEVSIGSDTIIHPQVTIYERCSIGSRVSIHASTVIGSDGFGYTFIDGQHMKVPHVGTVIIEDDVEIGANTVVDRATLGATVIGQGTKIDNLVQVAHSVKLGKHNILCAFTGIAGSTTSGNHVIFAANVGVSDHVRIDDGVILGARAGVPPKKHLKEGNIYIGSPARPKDKAIEQELSVTRIPHMRKNIKALGARVDALAERVAMYEVDSK